MYTTKNFKSKKALKEAVQAYLTLSPIDGQRGHIAVTCYSPGPFPCPDNGSIALEGPHYPEPHRNSPAHADTLADLGIAPVVTVLPDTVQGNAELHTPAGRRIVVCPATYRDDVTCASCQLCQRANRTTIVGFPAHGQSRAKASQAVAAAA